MRNYVPLSQSQKLIQLLHRHRRSCSTTPPLAHMETQRHLWQTLLVTTRQPLVLERRDEWIQHFESLGKATVVETPTAQLFDVSLEKKNATPEHETDRGVVSERHNNNHASSSSTTIPTSSQSTTPQRWMKATEAIESPSSFSSNKKSLLPSQQRDMSRAARFLKQTSATRIDANTTHNNGILSLSLPTTQTEQQRAHSLQHELDGYLKQKDPDRAWPLFQKAMEEDLVRQHFSPKVVRDLFFKLFRHPVSAYHVLQAYRTMTADDYGNDITAYADMYRQLCESIQYLNPTNCTTRDRNVVVGSLVQELQQLDRSGQQLCFPVLVSSLMTQKFVSLGDLARQIYQYVRKEEFQVAPGYWNHLLATSKYNRRSNLPYDEIFLESIQVGRRPSASIVMNALQNYFPYTDDIAAVQRILQGIVLLQQSSTAPRDEYPVNMAMLEALSTAAGQTGMTELIMPIWDIITKLELEPSIGIYENTIVTFCARPATYKQAFIVLDEMQQKGFIASRALLRSMSAQMRNSPRNIDIALNELGVLELQGCPTSQAAINAVLSAAAERGDIDAALSIADEVIPRLSLIMNSDSFSFAMEAIGKHLSRRTQSGTSEEVIQRVLAAADTILSKMESQGISPTQYVLRDYVEMLCHANEVDTATSVVRALAQSTEKNLLNSKIIYCVAVANAKLGNFAVANEIVNASPEPMPFVRSVIRRLKARGNRNHSPDFVQADQRVET